MTKEKNSQKPDSGDLETTGLIKKGEAAFKFVYLFAGLAVVLYSLKFITPALNLQNPIRLLLKDFYPIIPITGAVDNWGQFGDFFGGVLNPAIGIATIYLILVNVRLQKKELGYALTEMQNSNSALNAQNLSIQQQSIQSTFFNWLGTYRQIIASAKYDFSDARNATGLTVYERISDKHLSAGPISEEMNNAFLWESTDDFAKKKRIQNDEHVTEINRIIIERWNKTVLHYNYILKPSLKSLAGLTNWIENQPLTVIDARQKAEYFEILSSQLSNVEITFLFFHLLNTNIPLLSRLKSLGIFSDMDTFHYPTVCFLVCQGTYAEL